MTEEALDNLERRSAGMRADARRAIGHGIVYATPLFVQATALVFLAIHYDAHAGYLVILAWVSIIYAVVFVRGAQSTAADLRRRAGHIEGAVARGRRGADNRSVH